MRIYFLKQYIALVKYNTPCNKRILCHHALLNIPLFLKLLKYNVIKPIAGNNNIIPTNGKYFLGIFKGINAIKILKGIHNSKKYKKFFPYLINIF